MYLHTVLMNGHVYGMMYKHFTFTCAGHGHTRFDQQKKVGKEMDWYRCRSECESLVIVFVVAVHGF